ncbi:AMP-binding protein [candidate division WOR-3 bacterium]|nr:AMP-binding protein [candidate division WOR-3 bacterium]
MSEEIKGLGYIFERMVREDPEKLALKKGDVLYTYKTLKSEVVKVKNYLLSLGLKKGDKFAVFGENRPEWAISYLAIVRAGLVCVPLDRLLSEAEILHILRQSEACGVLASENCVDKIDEVKDELANLEHIIPMNTVSSLKPEQEFPDIQVDMDELAVLIFTSGTTGTSKAVMLSHNNIIQNLIAIDQTIKVTKDDTLVSIIPMHHTFEATGGFLYPLFQGSAIYYPLSLKPKDIVDTMKEANVSCLIAVPLLFEKFLAGVHRKVSSASVPTKILFNAISGIGSMFKFLRKPLFARIRREMGLGNLRIACAGGAALTEKVACGLELFAIPLIQGYGLTETAPVVTVNPLEKPRNRSVGLPVTGVEVTIHDPDANGIGEIRVRGPNVMLGYYKNEEATANVLKDGWFYTGDLGYFDEDGYLYITGRKKSVIVTQSGKNIFPEELEEKLIKSQWIKEVLVVPRIDQKTKKEQICALVFPDYELLEEYSISSDSTLTKEDIDNIIHAEIKKVNEDLLAYKRITQFEIREEEFPKTTTLKIKRHMFLDRGMKV